MPTAPRAKRLLLTRPEDQARTFADALEAALPGRFACTFAPLMNITPIPGAPDLAGAQALVFTSANGVAQFAAQSIERGLPAFCVGETTAAAAREAGMAAHSADGDVRALERLIASNLHCDAGAVVHVRGRNAAGDLAGRLRATGFDARVAEIYDQIPRPTPPDAEAALRAGEIDAITLFSPRSAAIFAERAEAACWDLRAAVAVSLSPAADAALDDLAFARRLVAAAPTRAAMLTELAGL